MFNLALTKRTAKVFPLIRGNSGLVIKSDNFKNEPISDDFIPIFGNSSSEININMDYIVPLSTQITKEDENSDLNIENLENIRNISAEPKTNNESSKKPIKDRKNSLSHKAKSSSKTKKDKKKAAKKSSKTRSKSPNDIKSRSISVSSTGTKETIPSPTSTQTMPQPLEDPKGFALISIPADTNSLYRCFSKYFHNEVNGHHSVRQKAVAFIRKNQKMFENIIHGNIQDFIDKHSTTNTLPEEGNIYSLAASHRTNLFIYDATTKIMTKYTSLGSMEKEIYVMCDADSNYNLLVKLTGKVNKDITVVVKTVDITAKVKDDSSKTDEVSDRNYFINIKSKNSSKKITPLMNGFTVIPNTESIIPSIESTKNIEPKKQPISVSQTKVTPQPVEPIKEPKVVESCVTTTSNDAKNTQDLPPIKSAAKEIISPKNSTNIIIRLKNGFTVDPKSEDITNPTELIQNNQKSYKNYPQKRKSIPSFQSKTYSQTARSIHKAKIVEMFTASSSDSTNNTQNLPLIDSTEKELNSPKNKTIYPKNSFDLIKQDVEKLKSVNTNISTAPATRSKINIKVTDVTIESQMSKLNIDQNNCNAEKEYKPSQDNKSLDSIAEPKKQKSLDCPEEEVKILSQRNEKKEKANLISPPIELKEQSKSTNSNNPIIKPSVIRNTQSLISPPIEPENKTVSESAKSPPVYTNGQRNYRKSTNSSYESRGSRNAPRENQNYDYGYGRRHSYSSNNNKRDSKNTYRNDYLNEYAYAPDPSYYGPNDASYPSQDDFFQNYYEYYGYDPANYLPMNTPQVMFQYVPPMPQLGENPEDNDYDDWVPVPVMIQPRYISDESYFERMALYQPPNSGYFPVPKNEKIQDLKTAEGRYNKLNGEVNGTNESSVKPN